MARIREIRTTLDFQKQFIAPAIDAMLAKASTGFSIAGFENLSRDSHYTFVSNHRDITCDPALFTYGMVREGWGSPLICLGDNLLSAPWIVDLVKINRGVTVKRGLSPRELLHWSQVLSVVLSGAVRSNKKSVWIAQREGRAKDGDDRTNTGILKMLTLSPSEKTESFLDKARALRIVPLTVSYEYDPCDALKARELHAGAKRPGEDELSMWFGISGQKGRIHIQIGREITEELADAERLQSRKEQVDRLAVGIDRQLHASYRLWPSNYVSFDLLEGGSSHHARYTTQERSAFIERMEKQLDRLKEAPESRDAIRLRLLTMYANPVRNAESLSLNEKTGRHEARVAPSELSGA